MNKTKYIWSNELSYAIGLFTADGYLSSDERHLEFTSKDFEQVENFAKCLGLRNSISKKSNGYSNKDYFHIQWGSVNFYHFLNAIGITNNKSLTISELDIPNDYFPDFLRGLLDGDGSISLHNHPESKLLQVKLRFSSASEVFLNWLRDKIALNVSVAGGYIGYFTRCWELVYAKNDSFELIKYIYYQEDVICLARKRIQAYRVLDLQKEANKLDY